MCSNNVTQFFNSYSETNTLANTIEHRQIKTVIQKNLKKITKILNSIF